MKPLRVLSLFDGISCGQVALERAGIPVEVYYASEIDKYAIQITQKNYPNTIQLGDINDIDFTQFIGKIDLIMGGSPCQDLSIAGNRKGLQGERSGLFYKFIEALEVIKPKYFLLENNVGMPQDAYEEISRLMGCYPIEINSILVSAQSRKRFYWTNIGDKNYNLFGFPTCAIPQPKNKKIFVKDILEKKVDEKYFLSNERIKDFIPNECYSSILGRISNPQRGLVYNSLENKIGCICSTDYKDSKLVMVGFLTKNHQDTRVYLEEYKCPTLPAQTKSWSYIFNGGRIRHLTPLEYERLQTLPDRYTEGILATQRYKTIGNGWTVDVIAHIFSFLKNELESE